MDSAVHNKRRASESEATEALALISSGRFMRVPPPLPYLPSDYQPRPDSPRRNVLIRNRLPSSGQLLTIEPNRESNSNDHFELIPYRDWTVIS
ncbi:hypothetical protein G6F50_017538 [Rhizopus delemar]|nr:hypothetical protein G6F50_017538 [Rhizopus delemar]